MKKIFYCLLLLFLIQTSFAQQGSLGILNYNVPPGYLLIKNDNVLTYYKEDKSTGTYCNFFIYKLFDAKGNTKKCFDFCWENFLQKPFKTTATATPLPESEIRGWHFITGSVKYNDNGVPTLALQVTFTGENKMQNIIILSNSDIYKKDIEGFIASVDVVKEIKQSPALPPALQPGIENKNTNSSANTQTNNVAPSVTKGATAAKNSKYEVWECNCPNLATNTQITTKLNTVVLSADGKYINHMPEKGLNGITPENSNETESWGTFTDNGNMLCLVNDKYGKMELYKIDAITKSRYPNSKSSIYKKVQPVDGLRFEGAYSPELSYYNGKSDIISGNIDPNKRPVIFFKNDGTYINEGITFSNLTYGDDFAIGKGTYEIVNYSLILTTQIGKKLQVSFTPILNANPAAADNAGFIINNNLFYRLSKNFVPHN